MGIGVSVFLIALGLILALAVDVDVSGLDLEMIGWILTLVGIVGLATTFYLWNRSRYPRRADEVMGERPVVRDAPVVREERVVRDVRDDPRRY